MALVLLTGLILVAFYLATYAVHRFGAPLGWDAPGYAWRAELAGLRGIGGLPSSIPPPGPVNPGRPGFIATAGLFSAVFRVHPLRMAEISPAVLAAAVGLAAGPAVSAGLGRPRWHALSVSLGVGTSLFVVRAINVEGYQDNVLALAVLMAALTPILLALRDRRAIVPAALLIGATGLAHWNVLEVFLAVLGVAALVFIPETVRAIRVEGRRPTETPVGALASAGLVGTGVAVAGIVGLLTAPLPSPRIDPGQFFGKVRRDLPAYRLPFTLGAAAVGALALAGSASEASDTGRRSRAFLVLTLAWCQVTVLAFVGEWAFGRGIPGHRVLAICLAIPILGTLGIIWLAERLRTVRRLPSLLGPVVVVGALGVSAFLAQAEWSSYRPVVSAGQLTEGATASEYLDAARVGAGRPIVFVIDSRETDAWSDVWLAAHTFRAALPAERVTQVYVFVGAPGDYLAQRPTTLPFEGSGAGSETPESQYNGISAHYFASLVPTYGRKPVALITASSNPAFAGWLANHPASLVGPGVAVVQGPTVATPVTSAQNPAGRTGWPVLALVALAEFALLAIVGAGWILALFPPRLAAADVAALAPAVGAAALLLGSVALGAAGLGVGGWQASVVLGMIAVTGWSAAALRRKRADA